MRKNSNNAVIMHYISDNFDADIN